MNSLSWNIQSYNRASRQTLTISSNSASNLLLVGGKSQVSKPCKENKRKPEVRAMIFNPGVALWNLRASAFKAGNN